MAIETTTSIDVKTLTPFKRFIMTLGVLPTSYLESMTYAELVMWFCNFLQNEVIPAVNNNAEAVKEIQNWINTLDLQDEVDNKLDEMAESGELQEIIADYLNSKAIFGFENVEELKSATNLIKGSYAETLGYYSINDGGGAVYLIDDEENSSIHQEILESGLYANLIVIDKLNVKQLGAYGDGSHDDTSNIQESISKYYTHTIFIPDGTYIIDTPLRIVNSQTKIIGESVERTVLKKDTSSITHDIISYDSVVFNFESYPSIINLIFPTDSNITHINIENIRFNTSTNKTIYGIIAPHCSNSIFKELRFNSFKGCILLHGWTNIIEKSSFYASQTSILSLDNYPFINTKIMNCYFNASRIDLKNGKNCTLIGCQADNGNPCYDITNSKSVTLLGCSTETYSQVLRNTNSNIYIYGGDYEGHSSMDATFGGFFVNQTNGNTYVNNARIHFEDLAETGTPSNTNIVSNSNGYVEIKANITTPYTYTNYITGTSTINVNDTITTTENNVLNKIHNTKTLGTKVELFRTAFNYGKNPVIKITGFGTYSHTSCLVDALISGASIISSGSPDISQGKFTVEDRTTVCSKDNTSYTGEITAEIDMNTKELVINYEANQNYGISLTYTVEYK